MEYQANPETITTTIARWVIIVMISILTVGMGWAICRKISDSSKGKTFTQVIVSILLIPVKILRVVKNDFLTVVSVFKK